LATTPKSPAIQVERIFCLIWSMFGDAAVVLMGPRCEENEWAGDYTKTLAQPREFSRIKSMIFSNAYRRGAMMQGFTSRAGA